MSLTTQEIIGKPEIVTIVMKETNPKRRRALYCLHCGGMLQITYKEPRLVVQGTADPSSIESEIQCRRCKAFFEIC